jgi:molybdopterin/thiamine biosynthesis adenylyltransferase
MLTKDQAERYRRNLLLEEVGAAGQQKLQQSRVLVVGLGGLGSPAALYLAAAGVGTLGLSDPDLVDLSNLQRQLLHATPDLGGRKVDSAAARLRALNPEVQLVRHAEAVTVHNALELVAAYDFTIDATDNFEAKFLLNDAAHFARKPLCHAGITRFSGQLMTVLARQTACYRCLFEYPPPPRSVASPAEVGVLGAVPGVIGALQAIEAIKYLLGLGGLLTNALLTYDALTAGFRRIELARNPHCPLCGERPAITVLGQGLQPQ